MSNAAIFDYEAIHAVSDGDKAFEALLLSNFQQTIENCLTQLQEKTISKADWEAKLHELKGAAANVGANALTNACTAGETMGPDHRHFLPALESLTKQTLAQMEAQLKAPPQ